MSDYQTHSFNVLFDGTFQDLIAELEEAGFDVRFHPPGLINSAGTLVIEKTPTQKALDERQAKNESERPDL